MLGKNFTAGQLLRARQELAIIDWNLKIDKWDVQLKMEGAAAIFRQESSFSVKFPLEDLEEDFDDVEAREEGAKSIVSELQQRNNDFNLNYISNGMVNVTIKDE